MKIESDIIGQTLVPCTSGSLDYLTVYLESTDAETFTAELRVWDHQNLICRQQVVISAEGSYETNAWIVEPPMVQAGQEYFFEIDAPEGKEFYAYYSKTDQYQNGSMRINDLLTSGDLAFEAGIRMPQKSKKELFKIRSQNTCNPLQNLADGTVIANSMIGQSFQLCDDQLLLDAIFQYMSDAETNGILYLYDTQSSTEESMLQIPFNIGVTSTMTPLHIAFPPDFLLQADHIYQFRFGVASGAPFTEGFELFMSSNSTYENGELATLENVSGQDLTFELNLSDPLIVDKSSHYVLFDAFPEHDCLISQPYAAKEHQFGAGTIVFDLQICDDGDLEAVYFNGYQHPKAGPITFELKDDHGHLLKSGTLETMPEYKETMRTNFDAAPVLYYAHYTLTLTIPDGSELFLYSNSKQDLLHFNCFVNGISFPSNIVMVSAMKPYVFEFEANEEQLQTVELIAFPNPFISDFKVEINGIDAGVAKISLYDFQGLLVYETEIASSPNTQTIHIMPEMALQRGYYTLRVDYNDQILLETVMKQ